MESVIEFLTEKHHRLILKGKEDEFEIHYDHPHKNIREAVVIIVAPKSRNPKLIRVVTVYKN